MVLCSNICCGGWGFGLKSRGFALLGLKLALVRLCWKGKACNCCRIMVKAKVWILRKHFDGFPKESDFEMKEEELPEVKDGEVMLETIFLSLDAYMRALSKALINEGDVQFGGQVAKVIQSKNPAYPVGCYVLAPCGWRTHSVTNGNGLFGQIMTRVLPDWPQDISLSMSLGALGMTGLTALYGVEEVLQVKPGEIVLVSGAAGAVGTMVGQICKMKGCKVVGSAGSEEKVSFLKEVGFDHVFNYRTVSSLDEALKEASPEGYNCYFEYVGGPFFTAALNQMKMEGRIAVCGAISLYNDNTPQMCPYPHMALLTRRLKIQGFQTNQWPEKDEASTRRLVAWMKEGKIKAKEKITEGFENTPAAFIRMLKGTDLGKALVKV
ncbi:prostaglandin reductase 1-like [Astyanax mexicanus]|uniref:Prostaglandin reductase 1 n=2 Tax=Astyanax mexicanus TaxID=7994 RepID=A0A8T2LSN3_ASTMX|nr:prostaglandin reductase 1-like [Astyanax mexicanus]